MLDYPPVPKPDFDTLDKDASHVWSGMALAGSCLCLKDLAVALETVLKVQTLIELTGVDTKALTGFGYHFSLYIKERFGTDDEREEAREQYFREFCF